MKCFDVSAQASTRSEAEQAGEATPEKYETQLSGSDILTIHLDTHSSCILRRRVASGVPIGNDRECEAFTFLQFLLNHQ